MLTLAMVLRALVAAPSEEQEVSLPLIHHEGESERSPDGMLHALAKKHDIGSAKTEVLIVAEVRIGIDVHAAALPNRRATIRRKAGKGPSRRVSGRRKWDWRNGGARAWPSAKRRPGPCRFPILCRAHP